MQWGEPFRARIHLRRTLGREPTREEVENAKGDFKNVTQEQIAADFAAGLEVRRSSYFCFPALTSSAC